MLLHRLAEINSFQFGDDTALIFEKESYTYRRVNEISNNIANGLIKLGIKKGDCVALLIGNKPETVFCAFACWKIGASILPMNFYYTNSELNYILDNSNAVALIAGAKYLRYNYLERLPQITENCSNLKKIIADISGDRENLISLPMLMNNNIDESEKEKISQRSEDVSEDDIAFVIYTGGTTGKPKGVLVSHKARYEVDRAWVGMLNLQCSDKYILPIPLFHLLPWHFVIASFITGASINLCQSFDAQKILEIIEREKITVLPGVPTMFLHLMETQINEHRNLDSLKIGITGGAVFPETKFEKVEEALGSFRLLNYYGLTEAGGDITTVRVDDSRKLAQKTIGRALPGFEVKIIGEDGEERKFGEEGEIAVRADWFKGYYNNQEETKKVFIEDSWLLTGDLGEMNRAGYIIYKGRRKDMYVSGGNNIYPAEIEVILQEHSKVGNVVVLSIPHETMGEVGRAYVVPRGGKDLLVKELFEFCKERLATVKIPKEIIIRDALPLTPVGKIDKKPLELEIKNEFGL